MPRSAVVLTTPSGIGETEELESESPQPEMNAMGKMESPQNALFILFLYDISVVVE